MPKFLSGRQKNLKLGVKGYTENENVLDILGRVGVGTSYATEYNVGIGGSVRIDGSVSIGGTLITDYIGVGSVSIANLVVDSISIGNTLGDDGSYIRSTGTGVTWASFPTLRTGFSTVGVSSQTQIITSYNTNFLDIFVNGVLLNASEYQASDGFTIIFNDQLNGGEIIDIFSYNTTSNYTGGGGGGGNITIGGDSLWTEAVVGIYTNTNVGINSDYPESALSVTGDVKVLGVITATNFTGDGSGLTNITATGTGVQIRDSGAVVGTAATIDFGDNISVSPISAGVVTVTSSGGGGGISGAAGTTGNIQFNNGGPLGADNSFNYDTAQFRLAVNNLQTNVITTTDPTLEINADTEISGILTATQFVGDGSGLTNITSTGSGVQVKDSGVTVGTAATINFGDNLSVDLGSGIATVTAQASNYANNAGVATIATYTSEWTLGSNSIQDYTFSGPGLTGAEADPTIYLVRGQKYKFTNNMGAHPFRIQSTPNGSAGTQYNDGITNNNVSNGTLIWDVQFDAPNKLYYQCTSHGNMGGVIHILDESGSGGITYWSSGSNGIHTTANVGISTNAASSSYVLDVHGLSRVVGNFVVDDELSVNDNLFVTNVATASTLTLTKDATVGENLTVTKDLTVSRNGNFSGVVTASQFTTQTGGTPTITSPNNLNLNANIVAISTDVTIGRDVLISNNLNVSGVSTFTNLTASSAKLSELTTPHSTTTKNYSVTVASKSDHRYSGGSGNAYYVDGVESPILHLTPGRTYRFTLSSGDMSSHPFRFYLEADKTTSYTTNVTTTATYTEIIITDTTPAVLHYQCSAHGYMGNSVITHSNVVNTPYSITGLNGVNITGVVTATSFSGDGSGLTGVASTDNIITDTAATFNNTTRITGLELAGITTGLNVSGVSTFANDISISGNLTVTDISAANITVAGTVTYDDVTNVDSLGIGTFRQGIDIKTGGANITGVVTATTFSGSGASLTTLNASELDSGTIPDARFPATLPALDGSALTTLNASELDSGTIPDARFPSTLPAVDGSALTGITTTQISGYTGGGGNSIVGDTTPQLGGNLDVNGKDIVSTSNGDIDFAPNGTGAVVFKGVTSNGGNGAGRFKLNCENNSHGITIQGPPHSAAANYTLTLPNDDGGTNTYLKSDGSGNLSWDTPSSGGISGIIVQEEGSSIGTATTINFVGSAVTATMSGGIATVQISSSGGGGLGNPNTIRTTTRFTATSGQTSFSVTYDVGYVDVFLNGNKLDGTEFTATDGSNVVLTTGAVVDDILEFVAYTGVGLINTTLTTRSTTSYTATSGQTTFAVSYAIGYVDVFQNGVKLDSTEFTATDGSNVVLTTGAIVNDILEFVAYTSIGIASISSSSQGLDVTGHLETDDLNVSGILTATSANFTGNVSIAGTLTYDDVTNVDSIGLITARSGIHIDDSIVHIGDTDTKIRFPAADTITAETGGAERLRITSGGSVGIGTDNPQAKLHISDGANGLEFNPNSQNSVVSYNRITSAYAPVGLQGSTVALRIGGVGTALQVTSDGKIGINNTNPNRKLVISQANSTAYSGTDFDQDYHVLKLNNATDSQTVGMQFLIGSNGEAAITATETSDGNTDLIFGTRGGGTRTEKLRITSDGSVGIGTDNPNRLLTVRRTDSAGAYAEMAASQDGGIRGLQFRSADNGVYKGAIHTLDATSSGGMIALATGGVEKLRITSDGKVRVPDDGKFVVGAGDDLQIYHDGTDSRIENSTGDIKLKNTGSYFFFDEDGGETLASFINDGAVNLYYNNSKKIETTTTGAKVTGILTVGTSSVTINGNTGKVTGVSDTQLAAISSSISDTAVDVFVYDTSKDSDGGAWRKRTQNTSWYNETLGTATRGTRKEFPAVAVIVAEETKVTIYDGDDPDLPMWMIFENGSNDPFLDGSTPGATFLGNYAPTSVSAFNGIICVGTFRSSGALTNLNAGLRKFSFIEDACYATNDTNTYKLGTTFVDRGTATMSQVTQGGAIVNVNVKDVAMTVLPNAPIDSATGLPVPTIAVATDGGISVIKDNGTVVDITNGIGNTKVAFIDGGNRLMVSRNTQTTVETGEIPTADIAASSWRHTYYNDASVVATLGSDNAKKLAENTSVGGNSGLSLINENLSSGTNGLVAFVASDYNTGWMHGDIKGAFLSDTDTTNAVAVYYDDFSNNDKGWGFVNTSISGGNMVITQQSQARSTDGDALNGIATGTKLVFTFTVSGSGTGSVVFDDDGAGAGVGGNTNYGSFSSTGSYTFTATKTASNRIRIMRNNGSNDYNINFLNITTEYDRSINNKGLSVFGTVTKSAVATGADLVAYSGWSASNNLVQPYNSDLNFGTGDFIFIAWIKKATLSTNHYVLDRNDGSGETDRFSFMINAAGKLNLYSGSTNAQAESAAIFAGSSAWRMVMVKRVSGVITFGLDGKEYTSTTTVGNWSTTNLTGSGNENLFIGQYGGGGAPGNVAYNVDYGIGEIANVRLSASAPSPEQFKKMYEDEKHLYQENAKATLYGSSDAVTALAYDEVTDQLHVGTSAGRSDFQGLRRINNTTTAVTTAISAHDEFIIEQ